MQDRIILASGSEIRAQLLRNAGLEVEIIPARVDEEAIRTALEMEEAKPRDVADALAEAKARKISAKHPDAIVLGCDQVLAMGNTIYSKPATPEIARAQLTELRGQPHQLLSAAVIYQGAEPKWRHVGVARLRMHSFSDAYLDAYLARNWDSIRHSVGCYKLEEEGVRLFSSVQGDYFTILGLPLVELLAYLGVTGSIAS
ncbi:septum formation protein Maf [Donghicola sp. C2-DW-16]|uniref:Nucleoside triphosphate pyrophosphatase n=1 Tax=Donghicola mangrovi TaxID=2729614 RepID=A0ABX2P982_9RHOB|nr:Maf family nucleotide pyrophosphatase [Donghicola mangrovi]NVO26022.1 septum formation protein Maf [Donghicola mangrovi]